MPGAHGAESVGVLVGAQTRLPGRRRVPPPEEVEEETEREEAGAVQVGKEGRGHLVGWVRVVGSLVAGRLMGVLVPDGDQRRVKD